MVVSLNPSFGYLMDHFLPLLGEKLYCLVVLRCIELMPRY